jgi:glycine cleavage system H protein
LEIRYTKTHEWVLLEDDNAETATVGVSERLILENGRVVFIELPELGAEYEQDEPVGVVETHEGVEVTYHAPVTGEVIEVNADLDSDISLLSNSPEGDGWVFRMRVEFVDELDVLMTPEEYEFFEDEDTEDDDEEDVEDY